MKTIIFLFIIFISFSINAQQSSVSGGGVSQNNTGTATVSYTIGLPFYTSHMDTLGSINMGLQHAYDIIPTSVNEKSIQVSAFTYPNPTTDFVTIEIKEKEITNFRFVLSDIKGKIIQEGILIQPKTELTLKMLPSSTYLISILQHDKEINTFKIIKH